MQKNKKCADIWDANRDAKEKDEEDKNDKHWREREWCMYKRTQTGKGKIRGRQEDTEEDVDECIEADADGDANERAAGSDADVLLRLCIAMYLLSV